MSMVRCDAPTPVHRCADAECPHFGQTTNRGCLCHRSTEQMLVEQRDGLLAALQAVVFEWGNRGETTSLDTWNNRVKAAIQNARATIRKATGEQHG